MKGSSLINVGSDKFVKISTICIFVLIFAVNSFSQYKGSPVKKELLIKALQTKQLPTNDIIAIIKSNGVDFVLTPKIREDLITVGAKAEIIQAIDENLRLPLENLDEKSVSAEVYDELIDQAVFIYKDKNNPQGAVQFLQAAAKAKPKEAAAYQMLGFVNLYGLKNLPQAKQYMKESVSKGGSAVFRVYHDDKGDFTKRCTGSLYISPDKVRFEADDSSHTFETTTWSINKVSLDTETAGVWKKHPIFKMYLKIGNSKTKFRFAPISGKTEESKMVAQLVLEAKIS